MMFFSVLRYGLVIQAFNMLQIRNIEYNTVTVTRVCNLQVLVNTRASVTQETVANGDSTFPLPVTQVPDFRSVRFPAYIIGAVWTNLFHQASVKATCKTQHLCRATIKVDISRSLALLYGPLD